VRQASAANQSPQIAALAEADHLGAAATRLRDHAGARLHLMAGPRHACWQALTLAGTALVIGVPAGIACGRLCWRVYAHQLGITPIEAVPVAVLAIMAADRAGWPPRR
jgi:hypothetical protein